MKKQELAMSTTCFQRNCLLASPQNCSQRKMETYIKVKVDKLNAANIVISNLQRNDNCQVNFILKKQA